MTLHNVNILMSLNLTPESDKFYVCFSTKEETRTRKTGSRTACTPALSVPRGPRVSAKTTRGPLRTNIGHSAPTGATLTGLRRGNVFTSIWSLVRHIVGLDTPRGAWTCSLSRAAGGRGRGAGGAGPPRLGRHHPVNSGQQHRTRASTWRSTRFLGTKTRALFSPLVQRRERERKGRD